MGAYEIAQRESRRNLRVLATEAARSIISSVCAVWTRDIHDMSIRNWVRYVCALHNPFLRMTLLPRILGNRLRAVGAGGVVSESGDGREFTVSTALSYALFIHSGHTLCSYAPSSLVSSLAACYASQTSTLVCRQDGLACACIRAIPPCLF